MIAKAQSRLEQVYTWPAHPAVLAADDDFVGKVRLAPPGKQEYRSPGLLR
jgi:hypothetical protein